MDKWAILVPSDRFSRTSDIYNDTEQTINPELISALKQYDINTILWSRRDEYVKELAL